MENEGDFDHEVLSSMGISNAKERLTILKWVNQHIGEKKEERKEQDKEKEKEREKRPEKQKNEAPETTVYLVKADFDLFIFILEVTNPSSLFIWNLLFSSLSYSVHLQWRIEWQHS